MSSFSPTILAFALAALTGIVILEVIGLGLTKRVLLQMGVRNMVRRPGQTLLLLSGVLLSTVLITASFGLNESLADSARTHRLAEAGELSESVTGTFTAEQANAFLAQLRTNPDIEAVSTANEVYNRVTLVSQRTRVSKEQASILAVSPDFSQVFGSVADQSGQAVNFQNLGANEVYLSASLALGFPVAVGDHLDLTFQTGFSQARHLTVTVKGILSNDLALNTSDLAFFGKEQVILPLTSYQQAIQTQGVINTFCLKNKGPYTQNGGLATSNSQAVTTFLQDLFNITPADMSHTFSIGSTASYTNRQVHQIRPNLLQVLGGMDGSGIQGLGDQGALQFAELLPALTLLLVGAGMLLLVLLFILLAAERRVELGMSRAIGLQRSHLVQAFLIEGCGYGLISALLGVPLGLGAIATELAILSRIPVQSGIQLPFHVWMSWQSLVIAFCLSVLTTFVVVLIMSIRISRMNIVAAIRDLDDEPTSSHLSLTQLVHALFKRQQTEERPGEALRALLSGLWVRGPLCLLVGLACFWLSVYWKLDWMNQLGLALLIAGTGLVIRWVLSFFLLRWPSGSRLANQIAQSLIGLAWLDYGSRPGGYFQNLFQPPGNTVALSNNPHAIEIVLSNLILVAGAVVLVMANSDVLVFLLSTALGRMRKLAPISRMSLVYPLTYRFRTTVTISLLGLITFLIMLIVTINVGSLLSKEASTSTGGFQLMSSSSLLPRDLGAQAQANSTLRQEIETVGNGHFTGASRANPVQLHIPGQPVQSDSDLVMGMNDAFLNTTTMPMQARADGYSSDRQVWDTAKNQPDLVVWRYNPAIKGISPQVTSFHPFPVDVTDDTGHIHQLTVIGIVPNSTKWNILYLSNATFAHTYNEHAPGVHASNWFFFRLKPGVNTNQAVIDLTEAFASKYAIEIVLLSSDTAALALANLTIFLGSYLALGLLFGGLGLGVITSRAVVERRQQIGMLRALGFSRGLVLGSFLLEYGFVITLSLAIGTTLALWTAYQFTSSISPDFLVPVQAIVFILLGTYLVTLIATGLPARRASSIRPAEALRYE